MAVAFGSLSVGRAASIQDFEQLADFTDRHCSSCHNDVDKEGGLDLTSLKFDPADSGNFLTWIRVHDRVQHGEMPPREKKRPENREMTTFLQDVGAILTADEKARADRYGRVQRRRLNRSEYENTLKDLFGLPGLRVASELPEDGVAAHFNKVSRALDVSHVHIGRYMSAAQTAIREALSVEILKQPTTIKRYYARESIAYSGVDGVADRMRFPVLRSGPDLRAIDKEAPLTVGDSDPVVREQEAMAWSSSNFGAGFNTRWTQFEAPVSGRYNLRFRGYTIWRGPWGFYERGSFGGNGPNLNLPPGAVLPPADPEYLEGLVPPPAGSTPAPVAAARGGRPGRGGVGGAFGRGSPGPLEWYLASVTDITPGRRNEPIHLYARAFGAAGVKVGAFDLTPEPGVYEIRDAELTSGQIIITDSVRLMRSRPGLTGVVNYTNPLLQVDGTPGVAFNWMEIEGPLYDSPTEPGYALLFGNLPHKQLENPPIGVGIRIPGKRPPPKPVSAASGDNIPFNSPPDITVEIESAHPTQDAERLLRNFLGRTYRRPVKDADVHLFLDLFKERMERGIGFGASMMVAYSAILASQEFIFLDEGTNGKLNDDALATRLALLLTNGAPDARLRAHAARGDLHHPAVLRAETDRLLADPKSQRFVQAFLDYWIDLRKIFDTTPDMNLYSDYFLDDALVEAAVEETQAFFTDLLQRNLPARHIIDSDYTYLNERLATHYGMSDVQGAAMRRVALPADSVRGGLMTQASVLKLTANGSTTSPVLRGVWIMERIVGYEVPLPPAAVPAIEPDIRGAVTIRDQLEKHRADESCAACHRNIDPPGFALESFDVLGAWRDRYRAVARGQAPEVGFGKNGWPKTFTHALTVDPSNETVDGKAFADVREYKQILLADEEQIARNLAKQLMVYATGAPIRFSDRKEIEAILAKTRASQYGVRSILDAVIQSELFLTK